MRRCRPNPFRRSCLTSGFRRLSGLELLRRLRDAHCAVLVLMLTARDASQDVIAGLDAGPDDYMVKPFDLGELAARLRALIRRAASAAAPRIEHGGLSLDPAARTASWDGQPVELSQREFTLLHELLLSAGNAVVALIWFGSSSCNRSPGPALPATPRFAHARVFLACMS